MVRSHSLRWAVLALAGACGSETGLVLQITRDGPTTPSAIEKLDVIVGVRQLGAGATGLFVQDEGGSVVLTAGDRDLLDRPYELLLHDGTGGAQPAEVQVAVRALVGGETVGIGILEPPQTFVPGELILRRVVLRGDRAFEELSTGCVKWETDGSWTRLGVASDQDCDLATTPDDCDDGDPLVYPGQTEVCANSVDDNCDSTVDEVSDVDADGVTNCDGDCRDDDPQVYPGAADACDGKDNDCDGDCDDTADFDGDTHTTCGLVTSSCGPAIGIDCDDQSAASYPGATELCDALDNDCNGVCDDGAADPDGDGYTSCGTSVEACGRVSDALIDCQPEDATVHPFADELCDGVDSDCVAGVPPVACYVSTTVENRCAPGTLLCDDDASDGAFGWGACTAGIDAPALPPAVCEAYAVCAAAGDPDPVDCARRESTSSILRCTLSYLASGELCPATAAPLPAAGPESCTWSIVGGMEQAAYVVGLSADSTTTPTAQLASCTGVLVVLSAATAPPGADWFFLQLEGGAGTTPQHIGVALTPALVGLCPEAGLACVVEAL